MGLQSSSEGHFQEAWALGIHVAFQSVLAEERSEHRALQGHFFRRCRLGFHPPRCHPNQEQGGSC
jgi:hypothetical protein